MSDLPIGFDIFVGDKKYTCLLDYSTYSNEQATQPLSLQLLDAVVEACTEGLLEHLEAEQKECFNVRRWNQDMNCRCEHINMDKVNDIHKQKAE